MIVVADLFQPVPVVQSDHVRTDHCPRCAAPYWKSDLPAPCSCLDVLRPHFHVVCNAENGHLVCGFGWIMVDT